MFVLLLALLGLGSPAMPTCEPGPYAGLCAAKAAGIAVGESDLLAVASRDRTGRPVPAGLVPEPTTSDPKALPYRQTPSCRDLLTTHEYAAPCLLYLAGDHETARGQVADIAKENPGVPIPQELRTDTESAIVSGFTAIWDEAAAWTVLALALALGVIMYRALRRPQLLLGDCTTDVKDLDAGGLKALVASELDRVQRQSGQRDRLTGESGLTLAALELPERIRLAASILKAFPTRRRITLSMHVLKVNDEAVALLALSSATTKRVRYATQRRTGSEPGLQPVQAIAIDAAAWTAFRVIEVDRNAIRRTPLFEAFATATPTHLLGTDDERSWALFRKGATAEPAALEDARRLYQSSLERDPQNAGALTNLAAIESRTPGHARDAVKHAGRAVEVLEEGADCRRPEWYIARYVRALAALNAGKDDRSAITRREIMEPLQDLLRSFVQASPVGWPPPRRSSPTEPCVRSDPALRVLVGRFAAMLASFLVGDVAHLPEGRREDALALLGDEPTLKEAQGAAAWLADQFGDRSVVRYDLACALADPNTDAQPATIRRDARYSEALRQLDAAFKETGDPDRLGAIARDDPALKALSQDRKEDWTRIVKDPPSESAWPVTGITDLPNEGAVRLLKAPDATVVHRPDAAFGQPDWGMEPGATVVPSGRFLVRATGDPARTLALPAGSLGSRAVSELPPPLPLGSRQGPRDHVERVLPPPIAVPLWVELRCAEATPKTPCLVRVLRDTRTGLAATEFDLRLTTSTLETVVWGAFTPGPHLLLISAPGEWTLDVLPYSAEVAARRSIPAPAS